MITPVASVKWSSTEIKNMPGGGGEEEIEMWRRRRRRYSAKEIQQKGSSTWEQEPAKKKEKEDRLESERRSQKLLGVERVQRGSKWCHHQPPKTHSRSQRSTCHEYSDPPRGVRWGIRSEAVTQQSASPRERFDERLIDVYECVLLFLSFFSSASWWLLPRWPTAVFACITKYKTGTGVTIQIRYWVR